MRALSLLLICFLMLAVSCGKEGYDYGRKTDPGALPAGEGFVELKLQAAYGVVSKAENGGSNEQNLNPGDFTVEVFNSSGVKIKKWNKYSEMESQVRFNVGNFTLKAFYGDSTATGFNVTYFAGKTHFSVEGQTRKEVSVTCRQSNVQMKINWGDNLVADYTDYTVQVYRSGFQDSLTFVKSETRSGYIPAGKLKFKIYLTDKQGKKRTYISSSMDIDALPNDFIHLTVNAKEAPSYDVDLSFKIDSSTDDRVIEVMIPGLMKPKDIPTVTSDAAESGTQNLNIVEGVTTSSLININAPGCIQSCILKTTSPSLLSLGVPAEVDLVSVDPVTAGKLKEIGLKWREDMAQKTLGFIDFTGVSAKLRNVTGWDHPVTFRVTDIYGQTSGDVNYTFRLQPAELVVLSIPEADLWSSKVFVNLSTPNGNVDMLEAEINDGSGWSTANATLVEKKGNVVRYLFSGLTSQATYQFRAKYNKTVSEPVSGVTETTVQVKNGNFEEWIASTFVCNLWGTKYNQPIFYPWANGETDKWWDTGNLNTMPSSSTATSVNYKCFPTVSYTTGRSGSAAQLMAVAVNGANTSATSLGDAKAGELFIGIAGGATGHSFTSRPDAIEFYYQYTPKGGSDNDTFEAYVEVRNGETVIGSGHYTQNVAKGAPVTAWTLVRQNITYSRPDLKATDIYIRFKSSTMGKPSYQMKTSVTLAGKNYECHGGSILLVDDLTLKY